MSKSCCCIRPSTGKEATTGARRSGCLPGTARLDSRREAVILPPRALPAMGPRRKPQPHHHMQSFSEQRSETPKPPLRPLSVLGYLGFISITPRMQLPAAPVNLMTTNWINMRDTNPLCREVMKALLMHSSLASQERMNIGSLACSEQICKRDTRVHACHFKNWILEQQGGQPAQLDHDTETEGSSAARNSSPLRSL